MKKLILLLVALNSQWLLAQSSELDKKVEKFLQDHRHEWHDLNVPFVDGQTLHDIIVKNHYTTALEIGTSTGHSTIWLAWAMSKTGGKVITVEVNKRRHEQAIKNLTEAGLISYVDARLGNAHEIVKQLPGPFDFVFSDADKDWYQQYFIDVKPKLKKAACYTAHNVADGNVPDSYLEFVKADKDFETTIDRQSRAGIMISYKK
ncbi:MAG: class I SAM-dependent methyltransferase [Bacteroidetes bacterium]|nr:class I SAM-dependent methyltransferase [Bacteroidota bacterium]MBS1539758.1 class I SAM-dependent methyltransferase [Bacteroidota bacterium]